MKCTKRKIVISSSIIIGGALIFAAGLVSGACLIIDQNYNWKRVNHARCARYYTSILTMLRGGETEELIDDLEVDAILRLWQSSRDYWKHAPLDISKWDDATIKSWQEARAYYEEHPAVLERETPTNISEVRELLRQIPSLEREGVMRDFAKIYTGRTPPPLRILTWFGPPVTLEDLNGKVVLLDFWGVWCSGCVHELPQTQRLYDAYNKTGLEVIAVHSFRQSQTTAEFLNENSYTFLAGIDSGETEHNYAVTVWPTYYLIDKEGRLAWGPKHDLPSAELIKSLLKD